MFRNLNMEANPGVWLFSAMFAGSSSTQSDIAVSLRNKSDGKWMSEDENRSENLDGSKKLRPACRPSDTWIL